jgi:hypothetical protein
VKKAGEDSCATGVRFGIKNRKSSMRAGMAFVPNPTLCEMAKAIPITPAEKSTLPASSLMVSDEPGAAARKSAAARNLTTTPNIQS